jgi:hypothetical protein
MHCIVHGRTDTCGSAYFTTFPFLCYGSHDWFETLLSFSCLLIFHMDKAQEEDGKPHSRGLLDSRGIFGAYKSVRQIGRTSDLMILATNRSNLRPYDFGNKSVEPPTLWFWRQIGRTSDLMILATNMSHVDLDETYETPPTTTSVVHASSCAENK